MNHFGDPCIHCGVPHDDVTPGQCTGDPGKAVPIAYRSLGVRWDNVEHFRLRLSDGSVKEVWRHIAEWALYGNFGRRDLRPGALPYDGTIV